MAIKFWGVLITFYFCFNMFLEYQIGTKTSYYDNGVLKSIQHFDEEGFLVDSAVAYHDDGSLKVRVFFGWGPREKVRRITFYTSFFKDGNIAQEYSTNDIVGGENAMLKIYNNYKEYSLQETYHWYRYNKGNIQEFNKFSKLITATSFSGIKIISIQKFKEADRNLTDIKFDLLDKDILDDYHKSNYGSTVYYHDLGDQKGGIKSDIRTNIANGNTTKRTYFEKGVIQSIQVWDGLRYSSSLNREERNYYENGQLKTEMKLINGTGEYVSYYQNGSKESKGIKVLYFDIYTDSRRVILDGEWKYYNKDGSLSYRFYANGVPTTDSNYYY